jgi:hypothetical protein
MTILVFLRTLRERQKRKARAGTRSLVARTRKGPGDRQGPACVSGVAGYLTRMTIVMPAALWIVQVMTYRPAFVNLWLKVTFEAVLEWKPLPVTL